MALNSAAASAGRRARGTTAGLEDSRMKPSWVSAQVAQRFQRASFDNPLPTLSPDSLARCMAAAYTSSSNVTVVLMTSY